MEAPESRPPSDKLVRGRASRAVDYREPTALPSDVQVMKRKDIANLQPAEAVPQANKELQDLVADLDADLKEDEAPVSTETTVVTTLPEGEQDIQKLMEQYKTPEALAKQLHNAELARRKAQSEKDLLLKSMQSQQATVPQSTTAPQRVEVRPWDKKKANDNFIDAPGDHLEEFGQHILNQVNDSMAPLFDVAYEFKLSREFPGLISNDSIPVIAALAKVAPAGTVMDKLRHAANQYRETYGFPKATIEPTTSTAEMKKAAETPQPQIKTRSQRTFTRAQIQHLAAYQQADYQRLLPAIERAYKEGRVKEA